MRPIPIDVLRAFVAVVDSRGFTRAAEELGRSQPAVSLQVKRLEELIDEPVFEKSGRLALTRYGEICLKFGRRLLDIHDAMTEAVARERSGGESVRVGLSHEFAPILIPELASYCKRLAGEGGFSLTCDHSEAVLGRLRARQLDVVAAVTDESAAREAMKRWRLPLSWISAPQYRVSGNGPLALVTTPVGSLYHEIAVAALQRAGRRFEIVCETANIDALRSAVDSGVGVSAFVRGLAPKTARVWAASEIAQLPDVALGLFAREGVASEARSLAETMIDWLDASVAVT